MSENTSVALNVRYRAKTYECLKSIASLECLNASNPSSASSPCFASSPFSASSRPSIVYRYAQVRASG